ncbi:MAG: lactonase family protein [Planctomycetota bacterium]
MKDKNRKNALGADVLLMLLAVAMLMTAVTKTATAKSLYVIADIKGSSADSTQPVQAYDVGVDGALAFQAQHDIPHRALGAVGMAIDSDSGYLFITYEASGNIQLVDGTTMTDAGRVRAPDAQDLAGVVFDHRKGLLYCVDRGTDRLYAYNWEPKATSLTHVEGSPFTLRGARAFGIALNEIDGFLYVANASNTVNVYDTSNWELIDTVELSRLAISVAVDVMNGFMYTGGGYRQKQRARRRRPCGLRHGVERSQQNPCRRKSRRTGHSRQRYRFQSS